MDDNLKEFSVHDIQRVATEDSREFAIARIAVLSTEDNSHGIIITEEILRRDVPSILGKWIVTDYNKWKQDSTTHTPNQKIVGVIPKDQEVEFVTREDGVVVAYVQGVISKIYATDVYDMFVRDNFRNMSVEMGTANDEVLEDGRTKIDGLEIYGITILGKTVNGSCPSANIEIVKFSSDKATEYYTKEKALRLSDELRRFAESLDSKDKIDERTSLMEENVLQTEQFAENEDDNKDVVMSEGEQPKDEPKSEESKEMAEPKEEPKTEDEKNMSEDATQMAEEPKEDESKDEEPKDKEMSCGGDDKEMGCGEEKTFSLEQFASEESLKELSDEMAELVKMESADDVIKKFAEKMDEIKQLSEKVAELEEFQTKTFEAEREAKVNGILAEVKNDLEPKQFAELLEESKEVTLDGLTAFSNRVKAFAYEYSKTRTDEAKEDDGVMLMASTENVSVNSGDVFERLSKKYK